MPDQNIEQAIKSTMDNMVDQLDGETQHRLHQAREQALLKPKRTWWPMLVGTSTMAAAVMLTWSLLTETLPQDSGFFEDVDLLAAETDPDFYAELEFLTWLDENQLLVNEV